MACAVLVPAARFLADAEALAQTRGADRRDLAERPAIAELAPYLDRLALVALVFPGFSDGRAYSQARILRERYGFRGELRATGQVLRDQFLFLLRAGFDSFEVSKEADAAAFADSIQPLRRVLPADRRRSRDGVPPSARPSVTEPAGGSACPGKVDTGFPKRTCVDVRNLPSRPVIRVPGQDRDGAVELLQEHHPHELMRPGRRAEAQLQV